MSNDLSKLRRIVSDTFNVGYFDRNESPCTAPHTRLVRPSFWFVLHFYIWPRCFSAADTPKKIERIKNAIEYLERQKKWHEDRGLNYPPEPMYTN